MPTYDYLCDACGHRFEQFQSMKDEALKVCPKCRKAKLRRLIGAGAGLIFKGSGFYITDYRDSAYTEKAKAESSAGETKTEKPAGDTGAAAAAPAATETKPAAKGESAPAAKPSKSKSSSKSKQD